MNKDFTGKIFAGTPEECQKKCDEIIEEMHVKQIILNIEKKEIFFSNGTNWLMKINKNNQIEFNREDFPNLTADDYAKEVITILEDAVLKNADLKKYFY